MKRLRQDTINAILNKSGSILHGDTNWYVWGFFHVLVVIWRCKITYIPLQFSFNTITFMLSLFFSHHSIILLAQKILTMTDSNSLQITSVNDLPGNHAAAAFTITTKSSEVFKEAEEISPRHVSDKVSYMVSCFIFLRC